MVIHKFACIMERAQEKKTHHAMRNSNGGGRFNTNAIHVF
jgi:hypothetical protein